MNSAPLKLITAALLLCLIQILPQSAIAQVTGTLQIAQAVSDRQAEADRLYNQGVQQYRTSQFQDALQSYQQALSLYQEIGDRMGEGRILSSIGVVYRSLGQYPQALEQFQQALVITRAVGDRAGEGATLNNIGAVYISLGQYPQALEQFQQALVIRRAVGDRAREGATLNNIGLIYHSLEQYPQALEQFQQGLVIIREVGDRVGEGTIRNSIGLVYSRLGQYPQALEQLQQALVIQREVGNRYSKGTTLASIGLVYLNLGQYPQALDYYQKALAVIRGSIDRRLEGAILGSIGVVYITLGQYSQALDYHQKALAAAREVGDPADEGASLNNIGAVYRKLGQYPQALAQYQQALVIARAVSDRAGEGIILSNMGLVYDSLGQYPQALAQYQQALVIARAVSDRAGQDTILNNIGLVYSHLGRYPQAIEQYQQALVISREIGDRAGEGTILGNLGLSLLVSGQTSAATKTLFAAAEVLESLRSSELADADKVSFFDTQLNAYIFLQQALIAQNRPEAALEISERGRARVFAELLAKRSSPQSNSPATSIAAPSIAQIKQIAREQNSTLVEYSIVRVPVKIEGREEWQPAKLYIWVVKPTGEIEFRSVDLAALDVPLNELINFTRQAIGARGRGSAPLLPPQIAQQPEQSTLRLQQLYQVLIEPIADLLPTNPNDHIVFIPQNELFQAPFPALQAANGKYLIESHTILTAPSIQVLGLTQQSPQTRSIDPSNVLIVGNPTLPSLSSLLPQSLPSLPGAEQEAIDIARQFRTQPLLGNAATETTIVQRMAKARIIHLAAHGLLNYGDPKTSGVRDVPGAIALAPSPQDDGLLTASEILNLKLNDSLVVLSACDTGLGYISGDGVIGLSRSLLSAGASSVVVSLWKVPDDSTAALMTEFYTQLQQQPDRAQALRQAMLKTIADYPDPIDWAAFTLIGETE
jgi:CHAT domain-containing protein